MSAKETRHLVAVANTDADGADDTELSARALFCEWVLTRGQLQRLALRYAGVRGIELDAAVEELELDLARAVEQGGIS